MSLLQVLRPALPILIGASVMLTLSMGLRQSLGIFMQPLTQDIGISVSDFTLAVAVQNLAWGFLQPLAGALTVRYGFRAIMVVGSLLYMAGLQNIPQEVEEAGRIDGANALQNFFYITLPLLGSTIRTSVYLSVLGSIQQFILVWIMSKGGPVNASETLATYMIRFGFVRFQLGYASAVAIYMFILCLTFSLVYQRLARQQDYLTGL